MRNGGIQPAPYIIESAARISDTFRRAKEEHGFHRYIMRVRAGKTTRRKKKYT